MGGLDRLHLSGSFVRWQFLGEKDKTRARGYTFSTKTVEECVFSNLQHCTFETLSPNCKTHQVLLLKRIRTPWFPGQSQAEPGRHFCLYWRSLHSICVGPADCLRGVVMGPEWQNILTPHSHNTLRREETQDLRHKVLLLEI